MEQATYYKKEQSPNFIVVGAAKAGTTSLYNYLKQHPEVFLPPDYKESRFFAHEKITNTLHYKNSSIFSFEAFQQQYENVANEQAIGDFGNVYLQFPDVSIPKIKQYLGEEVKIIVILRDPVERAFSAYKFACRNQYESVSFQYAIEHEYNRVNQYNFPPDIFHYLDHSLYFEKIKAYLEAFKDVKVLFFDDLKIDSKSTINELLNFLDVSTNHEINAGTIYNEGSGVPANIKLFNALFNGKQVANSVKPYLEKVPPLFYLGQKSLQFLEYSRNKLMVNKEIHLDPELENELRQYFKNDIENLEELLNKDLSHWKEKKNKEQATTK